jgi:hypothetical protein
MGGPAEYVILNPHREYGAACIERMHRTHGSRAVCCFTDRLAGARQARALMRTHGEYIAAAYCVDLRHPSALAAHLRERHRIGTAVPLDEDSGLPCADLVERLGLPWPPPALLRRFREKDAVKSALRAARPALRVNASRRVASPQEVISASADPAYHRFVLKPNEGSGNRDVSVFGAGSARARIEEYFESVGGRAVVMEEYIGGREYFLDGQMDAFGSVTIVAAFEHLRQPANGRHNLDFETLKLSHGSATFAQISAYAREVMQATGLTRSPFHLELKVDAQGPCLIEIAPRLSGYGNARICGELHGSRVDLIDWACHYYGSKQPYRQAELDWARYDAQALRYVCGLAERSETIHDLLGIEAVESLPEFYRWVKKPVLGDRVERTRSSLTMPWMLIMRAPAEHALAIAASDARRLIRWNAQTPGFQRPVRALRHRLPKAVALLREEGPALVLQDLPALVSHEARVALSDAHRRLRRAADVLGRHGRSFVRDEWPQLTQRMSSLVHEVPGRLRIARMRGALRIARMRGTLQAATRALEARAKWLTQMRGSASRALREALGARPWARAAMSQMQAETRMARGTILTASPSEDAIDSLPISHGEGTSPST